MSTILVTGATGTIGSQVIKALEKTPGVTIRAAARDASKAAHLKSGNVTPVDFDYANATTVTAAVKGVDKLFLATPFNENQVALAKTLVDAAKAAGVKYIVKLSAMGSDIEPGIQLGRWHRAVEKLVEASGIPYTFLRPNNFMENFFNYYPPQKDGNIYLPWGNGACSFIAGSDVGACAAAALTQSGHEGKAYVPTGAEVTGRAVQYVDVPEEAAKKGMLDAGMPPWAVEAMSELNAVDKAGYAAAVTDDVKKLTGKAPVSFLEFAKVHAAKWKA
jgi:uncharacterized protein YbjT (DUF2867 family)